MDIASCIAAAQDRTCYSKIGLENIMLLLVHKQFKELYYQVFREIEELRFQKVASKEPEITAKKALPTSFILYFHSYTIQLVAS